MLFNLTLISDTYEEKNDILALTNNNLIENNPVNFITVFMKQITFY